LVVNPPVNRMEESRLDLVVAGTREAIIMVEAGAKEVPEEQIVEALRIAHREIIRLCDLQEAFAREAGKPKVEVPESPKDPEIGQITCEVGVLPRTHGSALFTRGQTQALSIVTLGSIGDKQKLDGLGLEEFKRFMHHYNFPPFSVGEARPLRSPGRREIGHGALAERALLPVVPTEEEFPYTIRLVTEILSSNGSTSMASVCGSSLAMMDAAVPIKGQVAGIAMGLITGDGKVAVLSDIQGVED